jgi:hypothetical protein
VPVGDLQSDVFALAHEAGFDLEDKRSMPAMPWLTNRGHLNPALEGTVPESTLGLIRAMHERLGGDERALAGKRAGSDPKPDFVLRSASLIVEVDEFQHFTSDRLLTLELYPQNAQLAFDVSEYRSLIEVWSMRADKYRASKPTVDFPHPGGRRAQRAYFDAVRDLLAPVFDWTVLRVPAPECDPPLATSRLIDRLARLSRS